ncbi:hypothetical protein PIB30_059226 [Stylosanthes scabra]|uniref:Uncharacterized protein n=1 Tax=Stylosanthes scabra TaxID=79078 RepID=A0ABU6SL66_9FABA|nr:hypothetical protein [Stylosanthes scabra]
MKGDGGHGATKKMNLRQRWKCDGDDNRELRARLSAPPHSHCRSATVLASSIVILAQGRRRSRNHRRPLHSIVAPSSALASHIQASSPAASSSSTSSMFACCATFPPQALPVPSVYSTKVPPWSSSAYTSSPS